MTTRHTRTPMQRRPRPTQVAYGSASYHELLAMGWAEAAPLADGDASNPLREMTPPAPPAPGEIFVTRVPTHDRVEYMAHCKGGPGSLLVRSTVAAAMQDGVAYLAAHYQFDAGLGVWRAR